VGAAAILLFLAPGSFQPLEAAPARLSSARPEPFCIRHGIDTFRLRLGVIDPGVSSVTLMTDRLTQDGVAVDSISLFDDGTNGDAVSGDQVFTADGLGLRSAPDPLGRIFLQTVDLEFGYPDGLTESFTEEVWLTVHYIAAGFSLPILEELAPDVQASTHTVVISQPLMGSFPSHAVDVIATANRYYDFFSDDRDFLAIVHPYNTTVPFAASWKNIRNDVEGIGEVGEPGDGPVFDRSAEFGSSGALQGLMNLYYGNATSVALTHEYLHRWAAFIQDPLAAGAHWSVIERPSTGFGPHSGKAFDHIELVSGNTYRAWNEDEDGRYNDLEQYLMGLVPVADVASPIRTLVNPVPTGQTCGNGVFCSLFTADDLVEISTSDIISVEGHRKPRSSKAQKSFRSALIIAYDRPLSPVEVAYYDLSIREYEKAASSVHALTFREAAQERATLSTAIACDDVDQDGSCLPFDCDDGDPSTFPEAPETNDGKDNQCPGDPGHGLVDEISGEVVVRKQEDQIEFCWPEQAGAVSYEVARSEDPSFSGVCTRVVISGSCHTEAGGAPPEGSSYVLLRAVEPFAGSWGRGSDGGERLLSCQ
jgi:hypothetical protein